MFFEHIMTNPTPNFKQHLTYYKQNVHVLAVKYLSRRNVTLEISLPACINIIHVWQNALTLFCILNIPRGQLDLRQF